MSQYSGGAGFDYIPSLGLPSGGGAVPPSLGAFDSRYIGPGDPRFIGPVQPAGMPTSPDPEKGSWGDVLKGLGQTAGELLLMRYLSPKTAVPREPLATRDKGDLGSGIELNVVPGGPLDPARNTGGIGAPGAGGTWLLLGAVIVGAILIVRG